MPNDTANQYASKVAKNATERITRLEKIFERFAGSVSKAISDSQQQAAQTQELLDAVIQVVGVESITESVVESRKRALTAQADELRAGVEQRLQAGTLKPSDDIKENGFLVCGVADGEGNKIEEARVGVNVPSLLKQFKEAALGQKVGYTMTTPDGRILEVLEVYEQVTPTVQEVAKEAAAAATKAEEPKKGAPYLTNKEKFFGASVVQGPPPAPKAEAPAEPKTEVAP